MVATKRSPVLCFLLLFLWLPIGCSPIHTSPVKHEKAPPIPAVPTISPTVSKIQASPPPPSPSPQEVRPESPPEAKYFTHTIKWSGENLRRIALWYTGSSKNWEILIEANPEIQPRALNIGDSILIPENLIIRHNPMPARILSTEIEKKKESSISPAKQIVKPDKSEFFGPVDTALQSDGDSVAESDAPLPLETIE